MLGSVPDEQVARALAHYDEAEAAQVASLGTGLINDTFEVRSAAGRFVLQRVNPIFDPLIHHNIRAVTERLAVRGLETPRLVDSVDGTAWIDLGEGGVWRLWTFVEGACFDVPSDGRQAQAAGALVASFHRALEGLDHDFVGRRLGVHDTAQHLRRLGAALERHRAHRLHRQVEPLARRIFGAAERLPRGPRLPKRIGHGDLKFSNLRFAGTEPERCWQARCLIDLDTVGPIQLAHELGDAWRSWCNRGGEDAADPRFDLGLFEAAWTGYRDHLGAPLSADQRRALLYAVDGISLELSARFATDALVESYFGWDPERYETAGEHHLARARCQWRLYESCVSLRPARARLLEVGLDR